MSWWMRGWELDTIFDFGGSSECTVLTGKLLTNRLAPADFVFYYSYQNNTTVFSQIALKQRSFTQVKIMLATNIMSRLRIGTAVPKMRKSLAVLGSTYFSPGPHATPQGHSLTSNLVWSTDIPWNLIWYSQKWTTMVQIHIIHIIHS